MVCLFDDPVVVDGAVFCEGALLVLSAGSSALVGGGIVGLAGRFSATIEGGSTPDDVLIEALRVARLSDRAVNVLLD